LRRILQIAGKLYRRPGAILGGGIGVDRLRLVARLDNVT
jgi:hypothetical protein